jgi:hypothetical protein
LTFSDALAPRVMVVLGALFCFVAQGASPISRATPLHPRWAVVGHKDLKGDDRKFGRAAAIALTAESVETKAYDVVPVGITISSFEKLGLSLPLPDLVKVGQDIRAETIVGGEVIDYRVDTKKGRKTAKVAPPVHCL